MGKLTRSLLLAFLILISSFSWVSAQEAQPESVTVAGTIQRVLGCAGDWEPACDVTFLAYDVVDDIWRGEFVLPGGSYEVKVAFNGTWDLNYGLNGEQNGPNIPFDVPDGGGLVTFSFNISDNVMTVEVGDLPEGMTPIVAPSGPGLPTTSVEQPESVTIAGTIQSQLGCTEDWQPPCEDTFLNYDAGDDLWRGTFDLTAGNYEYKVALNGGWDKNYGLGAEAGGANIPLVLDADASVTFIFDAKTGWVLDSINHIIANVPGNFQSEIGCPDDWQPGCLFTLLQDLDGDGVYAYETALLPPGSYEAKVAFDESWTLNYGLDGAQDGPNIPFSVPDDGGLVTFSFDTTDNVMTIAVDVIPEGYVAIVPAVKTVAGNIQEARAYWVSEDTIAWNARGADEDTIYTLHEHPRAQLELSESGVLGGRDFALAVDESGLSDEVLAKFPHLSNQTVLKLSPDDLRYIKGVLRGQIAVSAKDLDGVLLDATGLQIPGVLDELYTTDAPLGLTFDGENVTVSVWSPTARDVQFHLYDDTDPATDSTVFEMERDNDTGVWSITGDSSWKGKYYLFEVNVYVREAGQLMTNFVTDPYSVSLSTNSQRSQIIDLNDAALKPDGWDTLTKPALDAPEDITIYETHIRDFSIFDQTVQEEHRGKYLAFTESGSNGMLHLSALHEAGLTHLHLLPSFDIATINENPSEREEPDYAELDGLAPDSEEQQRFVGQFSAVDGFNWGYDPYHFNTPEGSYATDADGTTRILEYRRMVQAVNESGLRVVNDVVYNHTTAAGQADKSVFDRIVPGYYHRLDDRGNVTSSTCCANTATEHAMMERFMVDSVLLWATQYKIDAFRFDLMGHHMKRNMEKLRSALDALTVEEDGVDGRKIYVYGEGWNFGEVADNARGENATQINMGGTGIGTFSDRLRDAVRGGSAFGGRTDQGFISGLFTNPNGITEGTEEAQRELLLLYSDQIMLGLAGNLRDYEFVGREGTVVRGEDVPYNDDPGGYALDPQEHIVYIEKHDNETLYDILQYKIPAGTSMADRVRMQNLGSSIVLLSQGVPFIHAGQDMLRSKSMDRNSYNSGDWFNRLDFTYTSNNWGVGLPPAGDNQAMWPTMQTLLAQPELKPSESDIRAAMAHFNEILRIRYSSKLFRLETASQVQEMVQFHNVGPDQTLGLIVMSITDTQDIDPNYDKIVVLFNARSEEVAFAEPLLAEINLVLHLVLAESQDAVVKTATFDSAAGEFTVPALTTAVFVQTNSE